MNKGTVCRLQIAVQTRQHDRLLLVTASAEKVLNASDCSSMDCKRSALILVSALFALPSLAIEMHLRASRHGQIVDCRKFN